MDHLSLCLFEHSLFLTDRHQQAQLFLSDKGTTMLDLASQHRHKDRGNRSEKPDNRTQEPDYGPHRIDQDTCPAQWILYRSSFRGNLAENEHKEREKHRREYFS